MGLSPAADDPVSAASAPAMEAGEDPAAASVAHVEVAVADEEQDAGSDARAAASVDSSNEADPTAVVRVQLPISEATEAVAAAPPSPPRTPLDDDVEDEDDQDQDQDHEEKQQAHGEQTTDMPSEETPQEREPQAGGMVRSSSGAGGMERARNLRV